MIYKDDEIWLRIVKISLKTSDVKERGIKSHASLYLPRIIKLQKIAPRRDPRREISRIC